MSPPTSVRRRPPRLSYTLEEFCEAVGISRTAAYQAIKKGELATYKNGRRRYVSASAAHAWLAWIEAGGNAKRKRK